MVQAQGDRFEVVAAGGAGSGPRRAGRGAFGRVLSPAAALVVLWWAAWWPAGCGGDDAAADADVSGETDVDGGADADADGDADADVSEDIEAGEGLDADVSEDADAVGDDGGDVPVPPMNALVVLTSDYATGGVSVIDLDTVGAAPAVVVDAAPAHGDAMLACGSAAGGAGERVFHVVERLGSDRVRRFRVTATGVEEAGGFELEDGTNPQDAIPLSVGQWAVPLYERNALLFLAGDLSGVAETVDLAALAFGADGLCEMHRGVEWSGRLYVSLQELDRSGTWWTPEGPGLLAVIRLSAGGGHELIDVRPGTAGLQALELSGVNPVGPMRVVGDGSSARMLVATVGAYGANDGGLEAVDDPDAETSAGFVVTEEDLGGDIGDWVVLEGGVGFAVVTVGFSEDRVMRFDAAAGRVESEPLVVSGGYTLSALADAGDERLAVADRTAGSAGVRLFDVRTGEELTAAPIAVGLPPAGVCRP